VTFDPEARIQRNEYGNEVIVAAEVAEHEEHVTLLRWWYPGQVADLLSAAGFAQIRVTEEFSDRFANKHTSTFVATATRP